MSDKFLYSLTYEAVCRGHGTETAGEQTVPGLLRHQEPCEDQLRQADRPRNINRKTDILSNVERVHGFRHHGEPAVLERLRPADRRAALRQRGALPRPAALRLDQPRPRHRRGDLPANTGAGA